MIIQERTLSRTRHMAGEPDAMFDHELEEVDATEFIDWAVGRARQADGPVTLTQTENGEHTIRYANGAGIIVHEVSIAGDVQEHTQIAHHLGAWAIDTVA
jgi:hypothetical protein